MTNWKFETIKEKDTDKIDIIGFKNKTNLNFLNKFIKKHPTFFRTFNLLGVISCFILFLSMTSLMGFLSYQGYKSKTSIQTISTILPFKSSYSIDITNPDEIECKSGRLASGLPVTEGNKFKLYYSYVPLVLLTPVLFIIILLHEFGHVLVLKKFNIKIDSVGFGILRIFKIPIPVLTAFVRENEREFKKASKWAKISIASAGVFANVLLSLSVFLIFKYLPITNGYLINLGSLIFFLSLGIALFNSLPFCYKNKGFLDGGVISNSLLGSKYSRILSYLFIILLILPFVIKYF